MQVSACACLFASLERPWWGQRPASPSLGVPEPKRALGPNEPDCRWHNPAVCNRDWSFPSLSSPKFALSWLRSNFPIEKFYMYYSLSYRMLVFPYLYWSLDSSRGCTVINSEDPQIWATMKPEQETDSGNNFLLTLSAQDLNVFPLLLLPFPSCCGKGGLYPLLLGWHFIQLLLIHF